LDYRSAYRVVGRAVAAGELDPTSLAAELALDEALLREALDPHTCLATRTTPGGAAPAPMDAMLTDCRAALEEARHWGDAARAAAAQAERALVELARART
jgi:argininosuccinate lyase